MARSESGRSALPIAGAVPHRVANDDAPRTPMRRALAHFAAFAGTGTLLASTCRIPTHAESGEGMLGMVTVLIVQGE